MNRNSLRLTVRGPAWELSRGIHGDSIKFDSSAASDDANAASVRGEHGSVAETGGCEEKEKEKEKRAPAPPRG